MKPGSVAVLGDEAPSTLALQSALATEHGAKDVWRRGAELALSRNELAVGGRLVTVATPLGAHDDVFVSLHGRHQGANALCAVAAAEAFGMAGLADDVVAEALGPIRVPGRLEVVHVQPIVVLDSAHNPAGAAVLADALEESFVVDGTRRVVIGMLSGRDPAALLSPLAAAGVDVAYCCEPSTPRALAAGTVADAARRLGMDAHVWEDPPRAFDAALSDAGDDDLVVVTGSFYVVGAVRGHVLGLGPHRG